MASPGVVTAAAYGISVHLRAAAPTERDLAYAVAVRAETALRLPRCPGPGRNESPLRAPARAPPPKSSTSMWALAADFGCEAFTTLT